MKARMTVSVPHFRTANSTCRHRLAHFLFVFGVLLALLSPPRALAQDISAKFPEPAQVTADYPEDAERWSALNVLYMALNSLAPRPMPKPAYDKAYAYQSSYNAIETALMAKGMQSQPYKDFKKRCDDLFANNTFRDSVLAKYNLTALVKQKHDAAVAAAAAAQHPPTAATKPAQPQIFPRTYNESGPVSNDWPYPRAFPLLLIFLLPVALLTWFALKLTGSGHALYPTRPPVPGGLPALPESLQVVHVPGVRYAVYVLSGMVLQKEEHMYTQTFTSTTGGGATYMGGGQFHTNPVQTTSHTETTREEIIWVRTPQGFEESWTLYNAQLKSRAGQILSVLVRALPNNTGDILLAYNHSTGILENCPALDKAHGTTGFLRREFIQWTANLTAAAGSAIVTRHYFPLYYNGSLFPGFIIWWFFGSVVLVTLSFLIVTPFLTSRMRKKRNAAFARKYLPGLRQFFEQGTPILQNTFSRR